MLRARAGDRQSLNEIVDRFMPLVWNVARAQGLDADAASDVVQSTWVGLPEHLHEIRSGQELTTWLIGVTRRAARKLLSVRRRSHRVGPGVPTDPPERPSVPTDPPERAVYRPAGIAGHERHHGLWRNFGQLSPRCQEFLRIMAFVGQPDHGMAAEPLGSAGSNRCLTELKALLAADSPGACDD